MNLKWVGRRDMQVSGLKTLVQGFFALGVVVALPPVADAAQWRWALGAQIDPASHGIVDLGYRHDSLSLQLLTDTLDLRYRQRLEHGAWEAGFRGALFGAELLFSPWQDGQPAPQEALRASYAGMDIHRSWWFSGGLYLGVLGEFRLYQFGGWRDSTRAIPKERGRLRAAMKMGVWRSSLRSELLGGFVQDGDTPGYWVEAKLSLPSKVGFGFLNQSYLGWSEGLTRLSRFRLGGLNPYVVPFAGMGWAESWVERYAVQRAGLNFRAENEDRSFECALGLDVGIWDDKRLQISPVAVGSLIVDSDKLVLSGGAIAFEEGALKFGGWSLFVWYERAWH